MLKITLRNLLIFSLVLFSNLGSLAQIDLRENYAMKKGLLYFSKRSHDFGVMKETDGIQTTQFIGYNIAKDPLVITDVSLACGCTSVEYKKDTLFAGDSIVFTVTYNPANQNGVFNKAMYVYNSGMPYSIFLTIKGEVKPKEKSVLDKYETNLGNLKVTGTYFDLGFLYEDEVDTLVIGLYNGGEKAITIKGIAGRPAHIIFSTDKGTIAPGEESTVKIIYDARQLNDLGERMYFLNLFTDDVYAKDVPLNINVHLLERFPKQTKRRIKKNPIVAFDTKEVDFGKALKGDTVKVKFILYNNGINPLLIRKIQPSCGCTASSISKTEIPKGDSAVIEIHFNTAGREGHETKFITVITNDPAHPISKLYLRGEIVENPNAL